MGNFSYTKIFFLFSVALELNFYLNSFFAPRDIFVSSYDTKSSSKNTHHYGPYIVHISNIEQCQAGGLVDKAGWCPHNISVQKVSRYQQEYSGGISVIQNVDKIKSTISVNVWTDGGYKPAYSQVIEDACMKEVALNITVKWAPWDTCGMKKGFYSVNGIPAEDFFKNALGERFMFLKQQITLKMFSPKGMIFCIKISYEFKPLPHKLKKNGQKPVNPQ